MTTTAKSSSRLSREILELANGMLTSGTLDEKEHEKITMRLLNKADAIPITAPIDPEEIRAMRERAHMSQAVFAKRLNLTPGYVSQLERGTKRATGAALALLNVIRRHGMSVFF